MFVNNKFLKANSHGLFKETPFLLNSLSLLDKINTLDIETNIFTRLQIFKLITLQIFIFLNIRYQIQKDVIKRDDHKSWFFQCWLPQYKMYSHCKRDTLDLPKRHSQKSTQTVRVSIPMINTVLMQLRNWKK